MTNTQAHTTTEYLILTGILLFGLLPLMYYSLGYFQGHYSISQIEEATKHLTTTADAVLDLGEGNQQQVVITIPKTVAAAQITGNSIVYTAGTFTNPLPVVAQSEAPLIGILPVAEGTHKLSVKHVGNYVKIGDQPYIANLLPSSCQTTALTTLTIEGYDFAPGGSVLVNNNPYPSSFITSFTSRTITLQIDPTIFTVGAHTIIIKNPNGDISNPVTLTIVTNILYCYNPVLITLAQRVNANNHNIHSDVTSLVNQLDGTTHEINNGFNLHVDFTQLLSSGSIILLHARCQQTGNILVREEPLGPLVGTISCTASPSTENFIIPLSGVSAPSSLFDIDGQSVNLQVDYVSSAGP